MKTEAGAGVSQVVRNKTRYSGDEKCKQRCEDEDEEDEDEEIETEDREGGR